MMMMMRHGVMVRRLSTSLSVRCSGTVISSRCVDIQSYRSSSHSRTTSSSSSSSNISNSRNRKGRYELYTDDVPRATYGNALVIGSSGVLGRVVQQFLREELHMNVLGADIISTSQPPPDDFCQLPTDTSNVTAMTHTLLTSVHEFVTAKNPQRPYLDVIVVAAGGYEMNPPTMRKSKSVAGGAVDPALLQNATAYLQAMERMREQNFHPVVAAGIVAQHYMNPHLPSSTTLYNNNDDDDQKEMKMKGTLMVVVGAMAALQPTPTMMGYGSAKNAVHHYVQSLGAMTAGGISVTAASGDVFVNLKQQQPGRNDMTNHSSGSSGGSPLVDSKLVRQAGRTVRQQLPSLDYLTVVGLLPTMLDTPANRQSLLNESNNKSSLKKAKLTVNGTTTPHDGENNDDNDDESLDFTSTLISPYDVAYEIGTWITTPALRPHSGALIKVVPPIQVSDNDVAPTARFELVR